MGRMAGHDVDILQSAAKRAARGGTRVGKVDNLDTKRRKIALELVALFGALPVVSLEQYVEAKILPDFDLIVRQRRDRGVDETNVADDLDPLGQGNHRRHPFVPDQNFVCHNARDQIFAMLLGAAEQIEMAYVKEIVSARRVTNADHGSASCVHRGFQCSRRYRDDGRDALRFPRCNPTSPPPKSASSPLQKQRGPHYVRASLNDIACADGAEA